MKEKDVAVIAKTKYEQVLKKERQEKGYSIQEDTMDANKESDYLSKEMAWVNFKEQIKKENKDFIGLKNIDKYTPWEKPEGGWSDAEKDCIRDFEKEWELVGGEQAASLGGGN